MRHERFLQVKCVMLNEHEVEHWAEVWLRHWAEVCQMPIVMLM